MSAQNIVVVALLLSTLVVFSQQDDAQLIEKMRVTVAECQKQNPVEESVFKKVFVENQFPDDNKNLKCFLKCVYQKSNAMNDAGDLNAAVLKTQIPSTVDKDKAIAAIDKCSSIKGSDACQVAFDVTKCINEAYGPFKPIVK